ncbi:hypothetical protein [Rhodococcus koreensis]
MPSSPHRYRAFDAVRSDHQRREDHTPEGQHRRRGGQSGGAGRHHGGEDRQAGGGVSSRTGRIREGERASQAGVGGSSGAMAEVAVMTMGVGPS